MFARADQASPYRSKNQISVYYVHLLQPHLPSSQARDAFDWLPQALQSAQGNSTTSSSRSLALGYISFLSAALP